MNSTSAPSLRAQARARRWIVLAIACCGASTVSAADGPDQSGEYRFHDAEDGISCKYFDVALGFAWPDGHPMAAPLPAGVAAAPPFEVPAHAVTQVWRVDVTPLVQAWARGAAPQDGLLVEMPRGDPQSFHSRESPDITLRPQLDIVHVSGRHRFLETDEDAALDCSTYRGLGQNVSLNLKGSSPLALRFTLQPAQGDPIKSAHLVLVRENRTGVPPTVLTAALLANPTRQFGALRTNGLASRHPRDVGLDSEPDVILADGFDKGHADPRWKIGMDAPWAVIREDPQQSFQPLNGPALRATIPKGRQLGLDWRFRFKQHVGVEPEEIYLRYYLWLTPAWLKAREGGKMPGLAGTYGLVGWGGRPWDGHKGWSLRGSYEPSVPNAHPAHGRIRLGTYAYDDRSNEYGRPMPWYGANAAGLIRVGRWYCIEQHLKLNTPGRHDALFEVWIDGKQVLREDAMRVRDVPEVRIEEVWLNIFHGGTDSADADLPAYIDAIVIARSYIGPMSR